MRTNGNAARLLAATAICLVWSGPAFAQDNGLESHDATPISNPSDTTIEGDKKGVFSDGEELNLENAGTIRGNGTAGAGATFNSPDGGIVFNGGPALINNSGTISGLQFGITSADADPATTPVNGLAIGSTITNSGSIIGENNDAIRLIGGGEIINSGYITGLAGGGTDGISMFAFDDQPLDSFVQIGSVTNLAGGEIFGNRFGVILSGGGTIDNAGIIGGNSAAILIQAQTFDPGRTGEVTNSGTINGAVRFTGLASASLINSGTITGAPTGSAVNSTGALEVTNLETGTIIGAASGIVASGPSFSLDNAGTIRGNGNSTDFNAPNGGVLMTGGPLTLNNSGSISGQQFGVSTFYFVDPLTFAQSGLAIGSNVVNSGSIIGDNNDGVRLIGGGTVTNSGSIAGLAGGGADGVSMFAYDDQPLGSFVQIGSVSNLVGGEIFGNRFGVILSGGGTVSNAGTIGGNGGGVHIQAQVSDPGRTGTVANSGTINGGVSFVGLASATLDNDGSIAGSLRGVFADSALTIDNSGTIRGDGSTGGSATPDGGIVVTRGPVSITNSGTISGQRFGITTALYSNPVTNQLEIAISGTQVTNSGSIIGDTDDGIRLGGGGTVTNSGYIAGRVGSAADGIAMFFYPGQDTSGLTGVGAVNNLAGGVIEGNRYGVVLDGGGTIGNAGWISSTYIVGTQVDEPVRTGTVVNSGTINGLSNMSYLLSADLTNSGHIVGNVGFVEVGTASMLNSGSVDAQTFFVGVDSASLANSGALNNYVFFEGVGSADVTNSGTIVATAGPAIFAGLGNGELAIHNESGGTITGQTSGVFSHATSLSLANDGTIRGNGNSTNFNAPEGGLVITGGPADIVNNGLISGQRFGITTADANSTTAPLEGLAIGSSVDNNGSIIGDNDDGIRLIGGGTVTNSGYIAGRVGGGADGVSMFAFDDQPLASFVQIGTVTNLAGGEIVGNRFGVILSGGGTVSNAGTISGNSGGVHIQATPADPGRIGTVTNSGTINGAVSFFGLAGSTLTNSGLINSATGVAVTSNGATTLINSGTINGAGPTAVQLSASNDSVTLQKGSSINGAVDGGAGADSLTLSGTTNTPTAEQTFGSFVGFETLSVLGGYWQGVGNNGSFNSTTVSGGTLAINGTISSPITVSSAARLGGTGTITGNVTLSSGAYLAPGNSIGTLNVTGNVNFGSGSIFQVETTPSGLSDKLAVNGNVTIGSGASVQVLAGSVSTNYGAQTIYTILTANNISGKFGSVTSDLAFLKPLLAHKNGSIVLTLARNGKPITSASTSATFGTASAVAGMDENNPLYQAVLVQSFDGARQAFAALSGGTLGELHGLLADDLGELQLGFESGSNEAASLEWTGSNSLQPVGFQSGSVMAHGRISVMLVGGQQAGSLSTGDVDAEVATRFVAGAFGYRSGRLQAMAGIATGWHDIAARRTVSFTGFAEHASSNYEAISRRMQGEISYALSRGSVGVAPYAGYSRLTIETPAFREQGGASALKFEGGASAFDQLELGVRMKGDLAFGAVEITPRLDLSVRNSRHGDGPSARFGLGGAPFESISSYGYGKSAAIDVGVDMKIGPVQIVGRYQGEVGHHWRDHQALLTAALAL